MKTKKRCSKIVANRKCKRFTEEEFCFQHKELKFHENFENNFDPSKGYCCFCGDECNPCSQSCGKCARRLTFIY